MTNTPCSCDPRNLPTEAEFAEGFLCIESHEKRKSQTAWSPDNDIFLNGVREVYKDKEIVDLIKGKEIFINEED